MEGKKRNSTSVCPYLACFLAVVAGLEIVLVDVGSKADAKWQQVCKALVPGQSRFFLFSVGRRCQQDDDSSITQKSHVQIWGQP